MKLAAILLVAACACGNSKSDSPAAREAETGDRSRAELEEQLRRAELEADEARKAAQEAQDQVERLSKDLEALDAKVTAAIDSLMAAQNDADRAAAKAKLAELQREQAEMRARVEMTRDKAAKAQRTKGRTVSKECMDNPLAKGCQ